MSSLAVSWEREDLFQAVLQRQDVYQTEIVGKSFEQFLKHKYKKKPPRKKQIEDAREQYDALFKQCLREQMPALQQLFDNAYLGGTIQSRSKGIMVVGDNQLRSSRAALHSFEPLSEMEGESGAIFAPHKWSLLRNDLMMLASIRAQKVFFLCRPQQQSVDDQKDAFSQREVRDPFWDYDKSQPRILARELAILLAAGYAPVAYPYHESLGVVFSCKDPEKAASLTLKEIGLAAAKLHNPQCLPKLLDAYGSSVI